jgi:hypothetical protein
MLPLMQRALHVCNKLAQSPISLQNCHNQMLDDEIMNTLHPIEQHAIRSNEDMGRWEQLC